MLVGALSEGLAPVSGSLAVVAECCCWQWPGCFSWLAGWLGWVISEKQTIKFDSCCGLGRELDVLGGNWQLWL